MKKEKTVRTYQRRTKSGKVVTVHQHTASYEAANAAAAAAGKKGAGEEIAAKKAKREATPANSELGFSEKDFKEWYHWDTENDPKNEAALRVEKALKKSLGAKGYRKFYDECTDGYSARGHVKAFKGLQAPKSDTAKTQKGSSEQPTTGKTPAKQGGKGAATTSGDTVAFETLGNLSRKKNGYGISPADWAVYMGRDLPKGMSEKEAKGIVKSVDALLDKHFGKKGKLREAVEDYLDDEGDYAYVAQGKKSPGNSYDRDMRELAALAQKHGSKGVSSSTTTVKGKPASNSAPSNGAVKGLFSQSDWEAANNEGDAKASRRIDKAVKGYLGSGYKHYDSYAEATQVKGASYQRDMQAIQKIKDGYVWNGKALVKPTAGKGVSGAEAPAKGGGGVKVRGLRLNPSEYNETLSLHVDATTGRVSGALPREKQKDLTKWFTGNNRRKVAEAIRKAYGDEAAQRFLVAATSKRGDTKPSKATFMALATPKKGQPNYAVHRALKSLVLHGGGDDTARDLLVRYGYPKDKAYSRGIKEVVALAKKYNIEL